MKRIKALIRKTPPPKPAMKLRTYLTFLAPADGDHTAINSERQTYERLKAKYGEGGDGVQG